MNTESTLHAIELAHKILQGNIVDSSGKLALNDKFFEGLDELLEKFQQTRELAEALREV